MYTVALNALLSNTSDDAACTLLYSVPRLLLYPAPSTEERCLLPHTIMERARSLRLGRAQSLWLAHDWASGSAIDTTIHTIHPARLPTILNQHIARDNPAFAFRQIYSVPFAPPVPTVAPLEPSPRQSLHQPKPRP